MIRSQHRAYFAVTLAYWAFMLSDGAMRMLVLLHFNGLGYSPVQLAWLFLLYEAAGIVTNLTAGWIAARFGLATTLHAGLGLQIFALIALSQLDPQWTIATSVTFVMVAQGLSGVAKDLAKMSSKSAVKFLAPEQEGALFRWVALLTGSKNTVKGFGFFLGAALLALFGFGPTLWAMATALGAILVAILFWLPPGLPAGRKAAKLSEIWSRDSRINRLSLARMFLFGARDVWFVVGVPVYFQSVLSDGSTEGRREAFFLIGAFMALWVILYGIVQAMTPRLLASHGLTPDGTVAKARLWAARLVPIPILLAIAALFPKSPDIALTPVLVLGLLIFGFVFAVNSTLHSYLILAFAGKDRVTMDVGFYYMANAAGRLIGTLLSGVSFQLGGLALCLATAGALSALSWVAVSRMDAQSVTKAKT